jgi:uncharacterized 2Fe-2S/4Fe-4S cluster protein (DUF4445 family)
MGDEEALNVYQFKQIKKTLKVLEDGQKAQTRILGELVLVVKEFSEISREQIRQEGAIKALQIDAKVFREFIKDSLCKEHTAKIYSLSEMNNSRKVNTMTFIILTFVTGLTVIGTGLFNWLALK